MDENDLWELLDMDGNDDGPPEGADPLSATSIGPATPAPGTNPNALEVDEWLLRKGRDLVRDHPSLEAQGVYEHAAADFYAAAFVPEPVLVPGCAEPLRARFLADLLGTPDYRELHASAMLHEVAAQIAALKLAEEYARLLDEHERESPPAPESFVSSPDPTVAMKAELAGLRAVGRALEAARAEVEECREALLAAGMGPGDPGANDSKAVAALYRRVRHSAELRRIMDLAGRFRRVAQSKQRQKVTHGLDDVVGVTLGGEIARLLPAELTRLVLPETELDTLRRIADREAMVREHQAVEPVGKGPVILVVDESGSMRGEKVHTAKAMGLAMAYVARRQRRWCALVAFSGDTGERLLALPPGRWDEAALLDWLEKCLGGGSCQDVPVREMPRIYDDLKAPVGKTDVVFVTDAICHFDAAERDAFLAWKARARARLTTLVIDNEPGDLAALSDECHRVASIAADDPAVGRVLSL